MSEEYTRKENNRKAHTANKIPKPACMAVTGGNGCKEILEVASGMHHKTLSTYQANGVAKGGSGRKLG